MSICNQCLGWMNEIIGLLGWKKCGSCGYSQPIVKEDTTKMKVKSIEEAKARYGEIIDGKWADEGKWMVVLSLPPQISANWINTVTGKPTLKIYCNKDIVAPLNEAFELIIRRNLCDKLKTFDGCQNIRLVRGSTTAISTHCYGIGFDINASENQLGQPPKIDISLVNCFKDAGFDWGGDFKTRLDCMHFSYGWE